MDLLEIPVDKNICRYHIPHLVHMATEHKDYFRHLLHLQLYEYVRIYVIVFNIVDL